MFTVSAGVLVCPCLCTGNSCVLTRVVNANTRRSYGPRAYSRASTQFSEQCVLNFDVQFAPFACAGQRRERGQVSSWHGIARSQCAAVGACTSFTRKRCTLRRATQQADERELSLLLGQVLSATVRREKYPKSAVDVFVMVLEDDGGAFAPPRAASRARGVVPHSPAAVAPPTAKLQVHLAPRSLPRRCRSRTRVSSCTTSPQRALWCVACWCTTTARGPPDADTRGCHCWLSAAGIARRHAAVGSDGI